MHSHFHPRKQPTILTYNLSMLNWWFLFQFIFPSFSEHFRNIGISVASLSLPQATPTPNQSMGANLKPNSSAVLTISSPKILAKLASVVATGGRFQAITRNEILLFLRQKAFRDCFFSPRRVTNKWYFCCWMFV